MDDNTLEEIFISGMLEAAEDTHNASVREAELEDIDDDSVLLATDDFDFEPDYDLD